MVDPPSPAAEPTAEQVEAMMTSRRFVVLLAIVSVIGVVVSIAAWCFVELIYQLQRELYTHLPNALGYHGGPPLWWSLPVLGVAGVIVALAVTRLPGDGGHLPAKGLAMGGATLPLDLPGVLLAGLVTVASGVVLGPEAPLIALGSGGALLTIRAARKEVAPQVLLLVGAAGSFAALSFILSSPLIAAVLLIEGTAIGGPRLRMILVPGLLAAGIGSLVSIGLGSFTGLSSSAYAISPLGLPHFGHPDIAQFGWTIVLAAATAVVARLLMLGGLSVHRLIGRRVLVCLPVIGLLVAGLAIAFSKAADKSVNDVLFSGQSGLPGLVGQAGTWSLSALALLIVFKGIAYSLSLGSFRGGPTFPALYLGAAGGILASHLPGFALTPAVAVGMAAAISSVLELPLSGVALATFLTTKAGTGDEPLIIVGAVASFLVTLLITRALEARSSASASTEPTAVPAESVAQLPAQ